MESRKRSIAKAISWRIIATLITFGFVYIFTDSLPIATTSAIVINAS